MPIPDLPSVEATLIEKTNLLRSEHRLEKLTTNRILTQAARSYASYLATTGRFSHTANGKGPGERLRLEGYEWCKFGENLALRRNAQGFTTSALVSDVMNGWVKSSEHKKNLLEPSVTEIGVGVAASKEDASQFISVQLFARPSSLRFPIEIKNIGSFPIPYTLNGQSKVISPQKSIRHWQCEPQSLSFLPSQGSRISSRYEARDKTLFILSEDNNHSLSVEIFPPQ